MARLGSKQPYESYYISFDFTNVIGSVSIASASVIAYDSSNATCTAAITTVANQTLATASVSVWVKGGTTDNEYKITCRITTSASPQEHYELDVTLPVAEL